MKFINNIFVVSTIAAFFVPIQWIEASENCSLQAQKIKEAVKSCETTLKFEREAQNEILSQIASASLTVETLRNYIDANCAINDDISQCVSERKEELADESCRTDVVYNHAIFTLNHVIRLNTFVCAKYNGNSLLESMIPNDGLKCFYGNDKYVDCVRKAESTTDIPDICANIDVRLNCLHTANDCANTNAVESFRQLFLLYKEKVKC